MTSDEERTFVEDWALGDLETTVEFLRTQVDQLRDRIESRRFLIDKMNLDCKEAFETKVIEIIAALDSMGIKIFKHMSGDARRKEKPSPTQEPDKCCTLGETKMQVLLVDKSNIGLIALKSTLTENGYEVLAAANGQEGLEILKQHPSCRLVISEWNMPVMDGIEFCKAVRSQDHSAYIYFMFLTSHAMMDEMVQCFAAGADDFVAKPYHPAEVLARLRAGERILAKM